ncbi:MAG TPA: hypothetical protein VLH09_10655 [Bryobacteraceae bacterium]|nr:hypothetical protein [Bryobacteraceae bacterium]
MPRVGDPEAVDVGTGQVRIRSNVCTDPSAWHLVPGDRMPRGPLPPPYELTREQKEEQMCYTACAICHRRSYRINHEGCDHPACRSQGVVSTAEAPCTRQAAAAEGDPLTQ